MTHSYRKKPVVIQAFQVVKSDGSTQLGPPSWLIDALIAGTVVGQSDKSLIINTLEGHMKADVGDWIIQGVKGELYPCKPEIFSMTYEQVEA